MQLDCSEILKDKATKNLGDRSLIIWSVIDEKFLPLAIVCKD